MSNCGISVADENKKIAALYVTIKSPVIPSAMIWIFPLFFPEHSVKISICRKSRHLLLYLQNVYHKIIK